MSIFVQIKGGKCVMQHATIKLKLLIFKCNYKGFFKEG